MPYSHNVLNLESLFSFKSMAPTHAALQNNGNLAIIVMHGIPVLAHRTGPMASRFRKISKLFCKKSSDIDGKPKRDPTLRRSRSFPGPIATYSNTHSPDAVASLSPEGRSTARADACVSSSTLGSALDDLIHDFPLPPRPGPPQDELKTCVQARPLGQRSLWREPQQPQRSASSASTYAARTQRPQAPAITRRGYSIDEIRRPEPTPRYQPRSGTPQPFLTRPLNPSTNNVLSARVPLPTLLPKVDQPSHGRSVSTSDPLYSNSRLAYSSTTIASSSRPHVNAHGARVPPGHRLYAATSASQSTSMLSYRTGFATSEQTLASSKTSISSVHHPALPVRGPYPLHLKSGMDRARAPSLAESAQAGGRSTISSRGIDRPFNPVKHVRNADSKWSELPSRPIQIQVRGEDFGPIRSAHSPVERPATPTSQKLKSSGFKDKLMKLRPLRSRRSD